MIVRFWPALAIIGGTIEHVIRRFRDVVNHRGQNKLLEYIIILMFPLDKKKAL
jgi:hypothetical protein